PRARAVDRGAGAAGAQRRAHDRADPRSRWPGRGRPSVPSDSASPRRVSAAGHAHPAPGAGRCRGRQQLGHLFPHLRRVGRASQRRMDASGDGRQRRPRRLVRRRRAHALPPATIITMISTIDRDPRGGAAHARLEIGPTLAPGSRRRVCVVSETYPPEINGVAMTLARLVDGLRGRGHAVSVVRPRQRVDRCGPPRDAEEFLVHGAPLPGYGGLQIGLPAAGALRRHWTRHRPDVVYVATEGPLGWSAVRAATRLRLPVVSGVHTNFHSYAKHYHAGWFVRVVAGYLRRFHNRTTATVVATADLRARLNALGFTNLSVLGRGVDSGLFTPERRCAALRAAWGVSEHDTVALYVGRIAPEKNLELAVEAYRAMQRVGGARRFVLVGDGPQRAALHKRHPDLVFPGALIAQQLAAHYAAADVFLFPSETETFGNVV